MADLQTLLTACVVRPLATALLHETDLSGDLRVAGDWERLANLLDVAADIARRLADSASEQS
jgi:hypothetical protein